MRHAQRVTSRRVPCEHQPAAYTLLERVITIAQTGLCCLDKKRVRVFEQQCLKGLISPALSLIQPSTFHAKRIAGCLNDGPVRRHSTKNRRHAYHPIATDKTNLNGAAIRT